MRLKLVTSVVSMFAMFGLGFGCVADQDPALGTQSERVEITNPSGLEAPTVTATVLSTTRIEVEWAAVASATKYYVFQSTAGGAFSYVTTTSETSYASAGLAADTEYSYKVQAADMTSASLDSNTATATTTSEPTVSPFSAPTNVTATAVLSTRIQVDWPAVTGAAKYYVFQAQGTGPMAYVTTVLTNGYTARGLTPNTTYSFEIQAVTPYGVETASSSPPASATTFLAAPAVTATAISTSRIEVEWAAIPGAVKYYVFQAAGAGPALYVGTQVSDSFSAAGLSAGTTYSFVVQAVDANDNASSNSVPSSATTFGGSASVAGPVVAAAAISSSRIELSWPAVTGAAKYYVFQEGAYIGTAATNDWTATGLSPNTTYAFVVQSVTAQQITSADSAPASATTFTDAPAVVAPTNVSAVAASDSQVFLSWDASPGATKYYVFQSQGAGPQAYVTTVSEPATSLSVGGLTAATEYSYVIQAVDSNDRVSTSSSTAVVTTLE